MAGSGGASKPALSEPVPEGGGHGEVGEEEQQ